MAKKPSLFSDPHDPECWICHTRMNLHVHHIYGGVGRRPVSDREGCWLYLCGPHHNMSDHGVHFDKLLDLSIKQECQRRWMKREQATVEDFIGVFGRNYLED